MKTIVELIEQNTSFLKYYAFKITQGKVERAEDLYQDTVLKLLSKPKSYNSDKGKFSTFASRVMLNAFLDRKRSERNRPHNEQNIINLNSLNNNSVADEFTIDYFMDVDINEGVYSGDVKFIMDNIKDLKPIYSEVLYKRIEGYNYKDIAKELNITIENVKSRTFRAKNLLLEKLEREWGSIIEN